MSRGILTHSLGLGGLHASSTDDAILRASYRLAALGLFTTPMLILRVGGGFTVGDVLLLGAVLLGSLSPHRAIAVPGPVWVAVWLIAMGGAGAAARSEAPAYSLGVTARIIFILTAMTWLALLHLRTIDDIRRGAACYFAGVVAFGIASCLDASIGIGLGHGNGRFSGLAQHVTDAGGICSVGVAFGVSQLLSESVGGKVLAIRLAASAAGLMGLILSGSVSGLSALGCALLVTVVRVRARPRVFALFAACSLAIWQLGPLLQGRLGFRSPLDRLESTTGGRYSTVGSRSGSISWGLDTILSGPTNLLFGQGMDKSAPDGFPVHNALVYAWCNGGILTLAGVLIVVAMASMWALEAPRGLTPVVAMGVAALVFAQTGPLLFNRYLWLPVILLLGYRGVVTAAKGKHQRDVSVVPGG